MTSEVETLKTNEFLRRRKLRLQQVREQSKDIAKKIRQRAKVEELRQIGDIDEKKKNEYLAHQDKLIKRLEELYARGVRNVGASHKTASEVTLQEDVPEKNDLSKVRGKEAAAELRRQKQEKLDRQKKLLDRKLLAREAANEISREKSNTVSNKLYTKSSSCKIGDTDSKTGGPEQANSKENISDTNVKDKPQVVTSDMATQSNFEEIPNEWDPDIPELALSKDRESEKESNSKNPGSATGTRKKLDLFALSDDMPSSLRGALTSIPEERASVRPSMTLISEYLQNRNLRLREPDTVTSSKTPEDLRSIKKTIMKTRATRYEGSTCNACHVADVQVVPVPSWQAEINCGFCSHLKSRNRNSTLETRQFESVSNSQVNKIFSSVRPVQHDFMPCPVLRESSPFRRSPFHREKPLPPAKGNGSAKKSESENPVAKKNSVTIYDHATRDLKDLPVEKRHVVRDSPPDDDAYSQAMKETSSFNSSDDHQKKLQEMRSKIAMRKQSVENEYKDTMTFLKSLPRDNFRPYKFAHMDQDRQQCQRDCRQRKMQQEYKKIQRECTKNYNATSHTKTPDKRRSKSKSPAIIDSGEDFNARDFQYSWMPVPDSDGNLAIHTIPTTVKESRPGNTVKFSKVDSYHEYRSRHKHTPPTKDTGAANKVETVIEQHENTTDCSSISSDSSIENLQVDKEPQPSTSREDNISDAERIIIYKILDSKIDRKKSKQKSRLIKEIAKSLSAVDKEKILKAFNDEHEGGKTRRAEQNRTQQNENAPKNADTRVTFEQLNEGVYKTVNEKGLAYNVMSCYTANIELWQSTAGPMPWWDNIESMFYSDNPQEGQRNILEQDDTKSQRLCACGNNLINKSWIQKTETGTNVIWKSGDEPQETRSHDRKCSCNLVKQQQSNTSVAHQSAVTSTTSFKTAANDKSAAIPDNGFIKLIDEASQESGKFYIGASGMLKNDAYEVVIQLRKKDGATETQKTQSEQPLSIKAVSKEPSSQPQCMTSVTKIDPVPKPTDVSLREVLRTRSPSNAASSFLPASQTNDDHRTKQDTVFRLETVCSSVSNYGTQDEVISDPVKMVDKGVDQDSSMSQTNPERLEKTDPMPRPATSTYTQTSDGSPNYRPVFFHMSSSTSTAYMSPPEMVLPRFLKNDYKVTLNETNNNRKSGKKHVIDREDYCEEYKGCACSRCTHAKKITLRRIKSSTVDIRKVNQSDRQLKTPPNTLRSGTTDYECDSFETPRNDEKFSTRAKPTCNRLYKCHKCEKRTLSRTCLKNHAHKSRRNIPSSGRLPQKPVTRRNSNPTALKKNKPSNPKLQKEKSSRKLNINPIVKNYVDKLLALNKEGLKAIEVVNQECSSVTTPGSSIIDVTQNYEHEQKRGVEKKISLEQIKDLLTQQILENYEKEQHIAEIRQTEIINLRKPFRISKKKSVHKVKSLNISKQLFKKSNTVSSGHAINVKYSKPVSSSSSPKSVSIVPRKHYRSKSSPSPRKNANNELTLKNTVSDMVNVKESVTKTQEFLRSESEVASCLTNYEQHVENKRMKTSEKTSKQIPGYSNTGSNGVPLKRQKSLTPLSMSTQTSQEIDKEINYMKLAEDKLQNMEKIADLTEKCTKRLSNLAKVLEDVRKNKSAAYSQISDSGSESDGRSNRNIARTSVTESAENFRTVTIPLEQKETIQETSVFESSGSMPVLTDLDVKGKSSQNYNRISDSVKSHDNITRDRPQSPTDKEISEAKKSSSVAAEETEERNYTSEYSGYKPFLTDIPKPNTFKSPTPPCEIQTTETSNTYFSLSDSSEHPHAKHRGKPPPALSRVHLKHAQDFIVPHELSTVIEVDSPMSAKLKNQSARDPKSDLTEPFPQTGSFNKEQMKRDENTSQSKAEHVNPDLVQSNVTLSRRLTRTISDSSEDSKLQMMDLKKFNEIMLKPFISIHEYAKQYQVSIVDEGSNLDDVPKDDEITDDLSSLHSDGSLPDVIAELLKRNIISEPFKYDTASNATTVSSESTSILALSKAHKEKKKASVMFQEKENKAETSDTLSISSNPDLENAFKKLGMGWASSTLKKTKERLALSSSSNTSSSSFTQFKGQNVPALVSDSVSSVNDVSRKRIIADCSKNAGQQTSFSKSLTAKEFLTNELAKKITFTNKSTRNETEEEFMSLYETKIPEEMKRSPLPREERSMDSGPSGSINRARTSTPVQIFKSMTYHSSSSSNMSNGLFSNADELSSVKGTSNSLRNHSTSDKDDLTIPNYSLRMKKESDCSKSD